jgi:hypothetical protein
MKNKRQAGSYELQIYVSNNTIYSLPQSRETIPLTEVSF